MSENNYFFSSNSQDEISERGKYCVMNKVGYLFENNKTKHYICDCNKDGRKISICEECTKNCHANHEFREVKDVTTNQKFICRCDHKILTEDQTNNESEPKSCKIKKFFIKLTKYSQSFSTENGNYCLYCYLLCPKKINREVMNSSTKCECTINHQGWQEIMNVFSNRKEFDKYINVSQLLPDLISNLPQIGKEEKTFFKLDENKNDIIDWLKIWYYFGKNNKYSFPHLIFPNDFHKILYSCLLENKKKSIDIEYKIYSLKVLLHYYFLPNLKTNFHLVQVHDNMNFFHRSIFNENIDKELEGEKQINKNDVLELMKFIINYIKESSENSEHLSLIFKLILTFLDYMIFLSSLVYNSSEYEIYVELLTELSEIIENIRKDDTNDNVYLKINKKLEKIVYTLLIKNNDYVIHSRIFRKEESSELKFSFEENEGFSNRLVKILFNNYNSSKINENNSSEDNFEINEKTKSVEILSKFNDDSYYYSNKLFEYNDEFVKTFYFSNKFYEIISCYPSTFKCFEINQYKEILSFSNNLNIKFLELKQSFYEKKQVEHGSEFFKLFSKSLDFLLKDKSLFIGDNIYEKNKEFRRDLYLKQILLYKNGFVDLLIQCWNFIKDNYTEIKPIKYQIDENDGEEITLELKDIYQKLIDILILISDENYMIYDILFTKSYIKLIKSDYLCIFYDFYLKIIKNLKRMKHSIFLNNLIMEIQKDMVIENVSIIEDEKMLLILKIMKYIIDVNPNKDLCAINKKVYRFINMVLLNPEVKNYFLEYKCIDLQNGKKLTKNTDNISNYKKLNFARNMIKCINNLGKEFFNLLAQEIVKYKFERVLLDKDLPPKYRKTFFEFFCLFYFGNHHTLKPQIILKDMDLKSYIDGNEIKNFQYIFDEEVIQMNDDNQEINEVNDIYSLISDKYGFFIQQLRKFPSLLKMMNQDDIKKQPSYLLKYFHCMIDIPTNNAIYKKLYLNHNLTMNDKLQIISIIKHYIQCYEVLLKTCKVNYINKRKKLNELCQYLQFDFQDKFVNEILYKKKLEETLKSIQKFNSDFDTTGIYNMNIEKCLHDFITYKFNLNHQINTFDAYYYHEIQDEKFYEDFISSLEEYNNRKNDSKNKLLIRNIFEKDEIIYENLRKNIINCFLNDIQKGKKNFQEGNNQGCDNNNNENLLNNNNNKSNNSKEVEQHNNNVNDNISYYISLFISIIKLNPSLCQYEIVKNLDNHDFLKEIMTRIIPFYFHAMINIFKSNINQYFDPYIYDNLIDSIEFLRLLCENHNKYFQSFIFNYKIEDEEINNKKELDQKSKFGESDIIEHGIKPLYPPKNNFISMLLILYSYTVKEVINLENKKLLNRHILERVDNDTLKFFESILNKITDFFVEICQGCFGYNFTETFNLENSAFFTYFETCNSIITNYQTKLPKWQEKILYNFIRFMITFLEQDTNPYEYKKAVLRKFNTTKLQFLLVQLMKKFYYEKVDKPEKKTPDQDRTKIRKDGYKKLLEFYIHQIENDDKENVEDNENKENVEDKDIKDNNEKQSTKLVEEKQDNENVEEEIAPENNEECFEIPFNEKEIHLGISISIFHFILISSMYSKKFDVLYKNLKSSAENYNPNSNSENSKREIFLFCKEVIRNVEIFVNENEENEEERELYMEKLDLKNYMIDNGDYNGKEVSIKKIFFQCHPVSLLLTDRDMEKFMENAPVEKKNYKLYYLIKELPNIIDTLRFRRKMFNDMKSIYKIQLINNKNNEIASVIFVLIINILLTLSLNLNQNLEVIGNYDLIIDFISFTHLLFLGFVVGVWYYINACKLSKYTHPRIELENDKPLRSFEIIKDYLKLLSNEEIFPLMWNLITGVLAFSNNNWRFFYSLQLFSLFNISSTMRSAVFTMQKRYSQLLATIFLIIIISLFFASISFMYYQELFWNEDLNMNMCNTFYHCFLTIFNVGFIAGSVDFSTIISIQNPIYWKHFIYSWAYYFFISIIMVNIINAIIVDTFQNIRENNNEKYDTIENTCFICSNHRNDFELIGLSFNEHTIKEHKVKNYFKYLMRIRLTDRYELNHVESYVLDCFEKNQTTFFPIKTSLVNNNK